MPSQPSSERPVAIYLVTLYFVLTGFLEAIQKYREWGASLSFNPFADHSAWQLGVHIVIYLALAYLVWNFTSLGRLAALVYGYLMLATYVGLVIAYLAYDGDTSGSVSPLMVILGIYNVLALVPIVWYLQPARQKKLFRVSLWDLLLSSDS